MVRLSRGRLLIWGCMGVIAFGAAGATGPTAPMRDAGRWWLEVRDDPSLDGWDSEALGRTVDEQMHLLADRLVEPAPISDGDLAAWVDPGFVAPPLVPDKLDVVFESAEVSVRRPALEATPHDRRERRGVSGLAEALNEWVRAVREVGAPRVKFKLVGIDPPMSGGAGEGPTATTRWVVELSARGPREAIQRTARWTGSWSVTSGTRAPSLRSIRLVDYEEVRFSGPRPWFSDCTASALGHLEETSRQLVRGTEHWMRRLQRTLGIDNYGHHGLAVGDFDGDGLEDLYVCQTGGMPNRLLIQRADGRFDERAGEAGVDFMDRTHAALWLDLDNDGDQDLLVGTEPALIVALNDGRGKLRLHARLPVPAAFSLAAADYDLDGDVDLYACSYVSPTQFAREGGLNLHPIPYHDANNGAPNVLLRNEGEGRFVDVTEAVGLESHNRRWSLAAAWEDYDDDGDPDLYVANDYGRNNLYRNDGGRFTDIAAAAGVEDQASGMSVSWGDYDLDGDMDLYVGNMFSAAGNRIAFQGQFREGADPGAIGSFQRFARGNSLFANQGDGTFRDVSLAAEVARGRWAWGSNFVDLDNNGFEDLVVGNGFITNEDSGDL